MLSRAFVALSIALFTTQASAGYDEMTPHGLEDGYVVALIGDSITAGVINDWRVPKTPKPSDAVCWEQRCYSGQLVMMASEEVRTGSMPSISYINLGYGGATSRDWDPTDYHEADAHYIINGNRPLFGNIPLNDIAIVYLGTNDAVGFFEDNIPTPVGEYEAHLYDLAMTMLRRGPRYVVLATPPVPTGWRNSDKGERMFQYGEAVRRVCRRLPVRFVDCFLDLQREFPARGWEGAAIHPTYEGHAFIASMYMHRIERLIRRMEEEKSSIRTHQRRD